MQKLAIDMEYVRRMMLDLLRMPSPTGYTDAIVHFLGEELQRLEIPFEITRRGAIRADIKGQLASPDRAIVTHLDTLGVMIKNLKDNGRCTVTPIGSWSSRFAEGCRVTIFTDEHGPLRGTLVPLKASGHTFNQEIDTQPVSWDNLELRVDALCHSRADLEDLGINVGDYMAVDPCPEITDTGFIVSRHLDDKAGVAALLGATKALLEAMRGGEAGVEIPLDCHLLFTITEEVGSGASAALHGDVAELVSIDNATPAPGQNSRETGVTIAIMDESGPFDYHLTQKLIRLCREFEVPYQRDVFRYYRTDAAAAVEAGNDLRTALVCFGVDASHGYERTHLSAIQNVAELLAVYMQSQPTFMRDRNLMDPSLKSFPHQPGPQGPR